MHDLPRETLQDIEAIARTFSQNELIQTGKVISERYRCQTGRERRLGAPQEAIAYAVSRMPATYGAAHFAMEQIALETGITHVSTHLDCGFGTGAVVLAANDVFSPEMYYAQELEPAMISVGRQVIHGINAKYLEGDISSVTLPEADLVTEGYMLGELNPGQLQSVVLKMWEATKQILLLIEPGTPEGFSTIQTAKTVLSEQGAFIIAPCISNDCPMRGDDWCHFAVRVPRSRLHKTIKGGDAPFEDEKFTYVAFGRKRTDNERKMRVLRHPVIGKGKISMTVCTSQGKQIRMVTKKDPLWKWARKADWGDSISDAP